MLGLSSHMNFYLCEGAVDMCKGIVSLSELVRRELKCSPDTGDVFIFLGKDRRNLKILLHETNGYVLYWKKLDRERFLLPVFNVENDRYEISWDKLVLLLQGTIGQEILVSLSLERIVERFKDVNVAFSSSTVLNWAHRHMEELGKLDSSLRNFLLSEGSCLFCDETTEQVKVVNPSTGKFEYRKKYIWGIKNPGLKVFYYLYDNGSRSGKVAERFFNGFTESVTTDGYNVYKLFERKDSTITRYACMAHVRCKFVESLQSDSRSADIVNLISELYWIESDCRIRFLSEDGRVYERRG